jgi:hypothetical protein
MPKPTIAKQFEGRIWDSAGAVSRSCFKVPDSLLEEMRAAAKETLLSPCNTVLISSDGTFGTVTSRTVFVFDDDSGAFGPPWMFEDDITELADAVRTDS